MSRPSRLDAPIDLLLLGASVRFLAGWFVRAGYHPLAIDLFADSDLASVCPVQRLPRELWPTGLIEACREYPGVPVVACGGLENHPELLDQLSKSHPILCNRGQPLRQARAIETWAPLVREAGLDVPDWIDPVVAGQPSCVPRDGDWLIKPRASAGGLGIRPAHPFEPIPEGSIAQRFAPGHGVSLSFCLGAGEPLFFLGCQELPRIPTLAAPPFAYLGNSVFRGFPLLLGEKGKRLATLLRDRLGLAGLVGVDGLYHQGKLTILEINPRPTASMELADPYDGAWLARWHIASFLGPYPGMIRTPPRERSFAKAILYADRDFRFPTTANKTALEAQLQVTLADWPQPKEPMAKGEPILTIILEESDPGRLIQRIEEAVSRLRAIFVS